MFGSPKRIKRLIDVLGSSVALIVLLPAFLVIGVLMFLLMGRPILFFQERPGLHSRPFRLVKFRTMSDARIEDGPMSPDTARITRFGGFCRRWSLDEIPSFWNILKGDMSLVGPRPLLLEYLPLYTEEEARRHEVRPGLTGLAQVNGRNALDWPERLALDSWYVDNRTLSMDFRIMFLTIFKVLSGDGVSATGEVTVARFTGTAHE